MPHMVRGTFNQSMLQLGGFIIFRARVVTSWRKGSKSPALHGLKKDYETPKMQCVSQTVSITVWLTRPDGRLGAGASQSATVACKYFHTDKGLALCKVIRSVIVIGVTFDKSETKERGRTRSRGIACLWLEGFDRNEADNANA